MLERISEWTFQRFGPIEGTWIGIVVVAAVIVLGVFWMGLRAHWRDLGPADECAQYYLRAASRADTLQVDLRSVPSNPGRGQRLISCGALRAAGEVRMKRN